MSAALSLSVKRGLFRKDDPSSAISDASFKAMREEILIRDEYTCQYCEYRSLRFQEVHHLNDDHNDNEVENLVTVCSLCHATQHLWFSGMKDRGDIIYLDPKIYSISQPELNQWVRILWVAELGNDRTMSASAKTTLVRLSKAKVEARKKIGSSDAEVLGDYLVNLDDKQYANRDKHLAGFFFLPSKVGFKRQVQYWAEMINSKTPSKQWALIAKRKTNKWLFGEERTDVETATSLGIINPIK